MDAFSESELFAEEKQMKSRCKADEELLQKQGAIIDCYLKSCGELLLRVAEVVSLHVSTVGDCQKLIP